MRRWLALAATTLVAPAMALTVPAAAQAAPATARTGAITAPVGAGTGAANALRRQFAKKTGITVHETARIRLDGEVLFSHRLGGRLRFAPTGVDAADVSIVAESGGPGGDARTRVIMLDGHQYMKSSMYDGLLPEGRTWLRTPGADPAGLAGDGLVDALRPEVLAAVLATADGKASGGRVGGAPTTLLHGAISLKALGKVSPTARIYQRAAGKKKITVPWKLWLGADRLPRRVQSTFTLPTRHKSPALSISTDVTFTGWGGKVTVTAPPAYLTVDVQDLRYVPPPPPDFTTKIEGLVRDEH
ncbi:hypothetical protein Sru01_05660 [Sphaerisporangium rufum]|uniref:DUF2092 domain-containing protein n=1 Tax=Sphaerisporangium rufum TaxID=1381558 RepID=A0A919UX90_9ACTN|nr:hypothetical protein [Sphaerisporangium rufum]GII75584.1 hypothetical protein Sru01_05660 [Sphaerisporangium rufum]